MEKTIHNSFKNVFTYAAGVEKWCKDLYLDNSGNELQYTFCNDFAIADWYGDKELNGTYQNVMKSWCSDYKAFTEIVIALNLLAWANDRLVEQGFNDREKFKELYSDMYEKAKDEFYEKFSDNEEARTYFFNMTD